MNLNQGKHVVVSLSGGMDSSTLLLKALNEYETVTALSFDYGQKHRVELVRAQQLIKYLNDKGYKIKYRVIKLKWFSRSTQFCFSRGWRRGSRRSLC
jgi:7-cyano-7-deazaguanine synthase